MAKRLAGPAGHNFLLHSLSASDFKLLQPSLTEVALPQHMVLDPAGATISTLYFPVTGVGSVIAHGPGSRRIEAGLFGREGMSGTSILLGSESSPNETIIQVSGQGLSIPVEAFRAHLASSPTMAARLYPFLHAMFIQASYTALSNGHAKLEERLARWLLMCHDRIDGDAIELTHDFLSIMLGVRRAGVTVGAHMLEGKGMIRAERGRITILDREGLEEQAHGSHGIPETEYERLFGLAS